MMIHKFFIKRFRTFFTIMMIPTIVIFIVFIFFIGYRFHNTLLTQGENSLTSIETNFDVAIRNTVYQQNLLTNDHNLILSLKKLIINKGSYDYSDNVFLDDLETILRSEIYSCPYIDSIYLYLDGHDCFFSSIENGIAKIKNYYDSDWYDDYIADSPKHYQWIAKRSINRYTYAPPEAVLTVFQRMSSINGVIVVNINENKFLNILNSNITDQNEFFYILDNNYSMILSNQDKKGPEKEIKNGFFHRLLKNEGKSLDDLSGKWIPINGKLYLLNYANYQESQINFVSLISEDSLFNQYSKFLISFLLMFAANCLIVLFLSYLTTKRIFNQIEYMIQIFGDAENGKISKMPPKRTMDEYDVIMNNIIHLFIHTTQMKNELIERKHRLEVAELKALQLQINPHFLLNTLQTMDLEATKVLRSPSSINEMIQNLSDILTYALGDPMEPVSIRDEVNYLKEYVSIQKHRFGDQFIVYYEIDEELMDYHVTRLSLQPLLENSIIHGVRAIERKGYIKIKIYRGKNDLHFRVIDNGIGLTREEISALYRQINDKNSRSIGLTNVNNRLILAYGEQYGLNIKSKKGVGTCISFKIPIQLNIPKQKEMIPF